MKRAFLILLILATNQLFAQTEAFDIVTYATPKGWEKEVMENAVRYTRVDGSHWAQIIIYKNTISKGDIQADFNNEWKSLVADVYHISAIPEKTPAESGDGWNIMSGTGLWQFNGNNVASVLTTFSGHGACLSIVFNATAQRFLDDYQRFIDTIKLNNGEKQDVASFEESNKSMLISEPVAGFEFTSTRFDDGWTATEKQNWVEVKKENVTVLLHYGITYSEDMRNDVTMACWNMLSFNRYEVNTLFRPDFRDANADANFLQAEVTDLESGNPKFISFLVVSDNGIGSCFEVITDSKVTFQQLFSTSDLLKNMSGYNKFAIGKNDVVGKWASTGSSFAQYYNVYNGMYAGMNAASISDQFQFGSDGNYSAQHNGATGILGNQQMYQQDDSGFYSVSSWEVTLNTKAETKSYNAYFQAIRGGRIMHLQSKKYTGMQYHLMKTN